MSREMKHSGTDWIGEIPVQWELAPTKRVFRGKKRIVGDEADNYERLALTLNGVVKRNKDDNEGLQPEQFNGYQILEKNELVFKLIDLQNIRTSRVGLSPYTGIVSPAYIILSNSETDNRFYYYWFMDMYNRCIFNQMGDDGVRSALNIKDVLEIPLPLIAESTRIKIASFLDKKCAEIDEMIALQEKIVEELKAYKQSVITEAVTKGLNPNAPMKDSGIEWIGEIPEHWTTIRIKYLLGERKERSVHGEEEPLSMSQKYGLIPTKEMDVIPNMASSFEGAKIVYVNDLVFNNLKAHLGVFATSNHFGLVSPDYAVYYGLGRALMPFMEFMFKTPQYISEFRKTATGVGSGLTRLYTSDLFSMSFPLPGVEEQAEIVKFLEEKRSQIDNLISIKLSKIDSLKEYKKSIIYEYVTGKKEVTE